MHKEIIETDLYCEFFPSLEKLVRSVCTARLLTSMKLAEIELFMLSVLFAKQGSKGTTG